ncbi:MAG TPA: UDP-N-acetylglucosamine 2-epimerase (non-hydrolyzing) [Gemmatimonadaceae bacterium]|jgi:UDP-N-acetylglucosamine 2-epimerase (non-hydrolysing)|nr:UDP-N-acetylglucosamine 2-epimerase (non-hydrolyzing) [Gemmatimonadaceae bacterium]
MKVMTVLGTRPEIIRLSRLIPKLDAVCDHVLVHTGQNFDPTLSDVFFRELGVRAPDGVLGVRASSFGEQAGQILAGVEAVIREDPPDRLLILGDTNSGLSAVVAKRMGIPVFHMEAGNRCFDDRVPEEVNRRIIDHSSDVLLPYTERSRANLLREGIASQRVIVTGNPIYEVLRYYERCIDASDVHARLGLAAGAYFLVTAHRAENVDDPGRLRQLAEALRRVQQEYDVPVVVSMHPRTRSRLESFGMTDLVASLRVMPPLGLFDFVRLERDAACVLTDSGTVQEECCILRVPNVTTRDVTERPETVECGSNIIAGVSPDRVTAAVRAAMARDRNWTIPPEYLAPAVSDTVVNVLLSERLS